MFAKAGLAHLESIASAILDDDSVPTAFEEAITCPTGDLLILERVFLSPPWRGFGLGPILTAEAIRRLSGGCCAVAAEPRMVEQPGNREEMTAADRTASSEKMAALCESIGFHPFRGGVQLLDTSLQAPIDLHRQRRSDLKALSTAYQAQLADETVLPTPPGPAMAAPAPERSPVSIEDEGRQKTVQINASVDAVLAAGAGKPLLPPPAERRHLRQMWGTSIEEVADALGMEQEEMEAWEAGELEPSVADQRAYCRLLHGFRDAMPGEYEPDWAALRPPQRRATATAATEVSAASAPDLDGTPAASPLAASGCELRLESRHAQRHVRLAGDIREGRRVELSVMVCTSAGEILGELDGEVDTADLNAVVELLQKAARATTSAGRTPAAAPSRGARWSEEDQAVLTARFRSGAEIEELAEELGRTPQSIRWELSQLNLAPFPADLLPERRTPSTPARAKAYDVEDLRRTHPNTHKRWQPEDDELLANRCAQGASLQELVAEFGRNEGAICSRLGKVGAQGPAADQANAWLSGLTG